MDSLDLGVRTAEGWQEIDWDTALAEIGARMAGIIAGGGQPALYMGNPNAHNYATGTHTGVLRKALGVRTLYSASTLDQILRLQLDSLDSRAVKAQACQVDSFSPFSTTASNPG